MLLQELNMTLMVKERMSCHSVLVTLYGLLLRANSLASGAGSWAQLMAVVRGLFPLTMSRLVVSSLILFENMEHKIPVISICVVLL